MMIHQVEILFDMTWLPLPKRFSDCESAEECIENFRAEYHCQGYPFRIVELVPVRHEAEAWNSKN